MRYLVGLVTVLALAVYSAPYLIKDQLLIWLKHQGIEAPKLKSISLNWLNGTVQIKQLRAQKTDVDSTTASTNSSPSISSPSNLPPLNVDLVTVSINYAKLFDQQILIEEVRVDGLNTGFSEIDKQQFLGPINLSSLLDSQSEPEKPPADDDTPSAWQVGIDTLQLANITFTTNIPLYQYTLSIDQAALTSLYQWRPSELTQFSLQGKIDHSAISLNAKGAPFNQSQQAQFEVDFKQLDLAKLGAGFAPQLSGIANASLSATVALKDNTQGLTAIINHQAKLDFPSLGWQQDQQIVAIKDFAWAGKGSVDLQSSELSTAQLEGKISAKQLLVDDDKEKLDLKLNGFSWALNTNIKPATNKNKKQSLTISSLDNISLSNLDIKQADAAVKLSNLTIKGQKQPLIITLNNNQLTQLTAPYQIALKKLLLKQGSQNINVGALSLSQIKPLQLTMQNNALQEIKGTPQIKLANVNISTADQKVTINSLDTQGPFKLKNSAKDNAEDDKSQWRLSTDNALNISGLNAQVVKPLSITSASISSKASIKNQPIENIAVANLNVSLAKLNISNINDAMRIASIDKLSVNNAQLSKAKVSIASISASQLALATQKERAPLSKIGSLAINNLSLANQSQLKISAVKLANSNSQIHIDQEGKFPLLEDLIQSLETKSSNTKASTSKQQAAAEPFSYSIGKLQLTGKNIIEVEDKSVDPWFKSQLNVQQLDISSITSNSAQQSPINLKATINEEANLTLSAQLQLLDPAKFSSWKLSLDNLSMPEISPYAGKFSGYFLENGKLSLNGEGKIENNKISGKNKITIEQLAVRSAESAATSKTNSSLNMPLDVAISVLEDDEGNIKLTVPVSGSLDDPNFGYSSILEIIAKKGLKKAAFGILSKALQPYGALITLATTAIDAKNSGTFINLAPVSFAAGSSKVDKKMQGYLVKIAKMMKQRKKLKLKICGTGVQQDHTSISLDMVAVNAKRDKPLPSKALNKAILNTLQSLADQRGKIVQKALLKQKVDKKRLFTCFAKTNLKNAKLKPSVSLGL